MDHRTFCPEHYEALSKLLVDSIRRGHHLLSLTPVWEYPSADPFHDGGSADHTWRDPAWADSLAVLDILRELGVVSLSETNRTIAAQPTWSVHGVDRETAEMIWHEVGKQLLGFEPDSCEMVVISNTAIDTATSPRAKVSVCDVIPPNQHSMGQLFYSVTREYLSWHEAAVQVCVLIAEQFFSPVRSFWEGLQPGDEPAPIDEWFACWQRTDWEHLVLEMRRERTAVKIQLQQNAGQHSPLPQSPDEESPEHQSRLRPAYKKAWASWKLAEERLGTPTDDAAYDWLKEAPDGIFIGDLAPYADDLPSRESWQRYVREARKVLGESKNSSRAGRPSGKSVVRDSEA